jgi:hypothetical protein
MKVCKSEFLYEKRIFKDKGYISNLAGSGKPIMSSVLLSVRLQIILENLLSFSKES